MKKCITCSVHTLEMREFEITSDGRVWPCCYFANLWDLREDQDAPMKLMDDPVIKDTFDNDPDWNNLEKYALSDITQHQLFWDHIWYPGWDRDTQSPVCVEECGDFQDIVTGETTQRSRLT
jgi:hypothetical protein